MAGASKQYPKLLAFLQLFYPTLYNEFCLRSQKADVVEANLVCSNNAHSYQAIIYSEDVAKDGELLEVYTGKDTIAPYSWDWRWVFAVKVLFLGNDTFPIRFKQKVIALPTGRNPLTEVFFNIIQEDFEFVLEKVLKQSTQEKISIHESYSKYLISIKL